MYLTTGEVIRRIRKTRGMTQAELGGLLGYSQPVISQLEHDSAAVHDVRVLRHIARALQVPLAILVVESDEEADVKRRQFFKTGGRALIAAPFATTTLPQPERPAAAATGSRVGAGEVAAIRSAIREIGDLDWIVGGDHLCETAASHVRYIEHLLHTGSYTSDVEQELTSAAADMMTTTGWIYFDAGRRDESLHYYARATRTAHASGDPFATAHALLNASTLATTGAISYGEGSRPKEGIRLAEAAQPTALRYGGPHLRALVALREAVAHGATGDKTAVNTALGQAHRAYQSSHGHDPDWVQLPEAELNALTGIAQMAAGDHRTAHHHLEAALHGEDSGPFHAHTTVRMAQNHIQAGDIAEGSALLTTHYDTITTIASTRLHTLIHGITNELRPHSHVPEVRELLATITNP